MALSTPTLLASVTATGSGTSLTTGDFTPTANALLLMAVTLLKAAAPAPTITGADDTLTGTGDWTLLTPVVSAANNVNEVTWLWAIAGSSPGTGTATVSWTNASLPSAMSVYEITGHNITTPIKQSKSGSSTGDDTPSITLDSTPDADSCVLAVINSRNDTAMTPGANFTELLDVRVDAAVDVLHQTQYDAADATTTVDWADAATTNNCMYAIEVDTGGASLTVQALAQAQSIENVVLTRNDVLPAPAGLTQAQAIDNIELTSHVPGAIVVDNISQAQAIDNVALERGDVITVAGLTQAQTIENVTLTGHEPGVTELNIQDVTQAQTIESFTLTPGYDIFVEDIASAQFITGIGGLGPIPTEPGGLASAQTIDNLVLVGHGGGPVTDASRDYVRVGKLPWTR